VGWLYAPGVLDKIRVRITPTRPGQRLFVGIGPADDVERYLAGVKHTRIVDFWGRGVEKVDGDNAAPPPGAQAFWVASTSGSGPRTLVWKPTGGSWSVVVMNADGPRAIAVSADLGARLPALLWIALVSLLLATVCLAGGALLVIGAIRRRRASRLGTYAKRGGTNHAAD